MNQTVPKSQVLVIDDQKEYYDVVRQLLPSDQFEVIWARTRIHAIERMSKHRADLVILDIRLSERSDDTSGLDLLKELRERWDTVQVIVFTNYYMEPEMVVRCMKLGAYYYFLKTQFGTEPERFLILVHEAITYRPQHDVLEDNYPHPLALLYRDYRRNVVAPHLKFRRLIELTELVVKFSAIVALAALQATSSLDFDRTALLRPSLGGWFELLQTALASSSHGLWIDNLREIFTGQRRQDVGALIKVRNEWLGHGALRSDHEYGQMVQKWDTAIVTLLNAARIFGVWQLFKVESMRLVDEGRFVHKVINIKGHSSKFLHEEIAMTGGYKADKVYIGDATAQKFLCLHPFLVVFICEQCNQETVFVYDKVDKDRILYLDYANGHHSSSAEPYRALTSFLRSPETPIQ